MKQIEQRVATLLINYGAFIRAVNNTVRAYINGEQALSNVNKAGLNLALEQIALDHYSVFDSIVTRDVETVARDALEASRVTTPVTTRFEDADALVRLQDELESISRAQYQSLIEKDVQTITQAYGISAWHLSKLIAAGAKKEAALPVVRKMLEKHTGLFVDRAGRQWNGERYIQITLGYNLYRAWNETVIYSAIVQGLSGVFLNGEDGSKEEMPLADIDQAMVILDERLHVGSKRWLTVD